MKRLYLIIIFFVVIFFTGIFYTMKSINTYFSSLNEIETVSVNTTILKLNSTYVF